MQYLGPKIWNNLPKLVKDCKTVKTFQKQLTKDLLGVDHLTTLYNASIMILQLTFD